MHKRKTEAGLGDYLVCLPEVSHVSITTARELDWQRNSLQAAIEAERNSVEDNLPHDGLHAR